jgi:MYXO-CTERM domain-containing protein
MAVTKCNSNQVAMNNKAARGNACNVGSTRNAGSTRKAGWTKAVALAVASVASGLLGFTSAAYASDIDLQNGNSIVQINPGTENTNPAGIYDWTINGTANQVSQDWYAYSVNNQTPVQLNTLGGTPVVSTFSTTGSGPSNYATIAYNDTTNFIKTAINYVLVGGSAASKTSNISQQVQITNTGSSALHMQFFVFANFTLDGSDSNQNVTVTGNNTATQTDSHGGQVQMVMSPRASYAAAEDDNSLKTLLGAPDATLAGQPTAVVNVDGSWAFEYDITLTPNQTIALGGQTQLISGTVPEPTGTGLALLGAAGIFLMRSRRRDEDADPRNEIVAQA